MASTDELVHLLLAFLILIPFLVPALVVLGKGQRRKEKPKLKLPPGPPQLPVIGNSHKLGKHPHRTLWELSKRYGPLMRLQLGRVPAVVVSSSQLAEEVLKVHDLKFCSRPASTPWKRLSFNFSDVALAPYSATWRELKKISVVSLLNTKKVDGFRALREEEVKRMMISISSLASPSQPINLSKLLFSLSNSVSSKVVFGKRFHNARQTPQEINRMHQIISEAQALSVEPFAADQFSWAGWVVDVLIGRQARLENNSMALDALFQEAIKAHVDPMRPSDDEEDFLDVLLRLQKEDANLTNDNVKGLLLDALLGGTDTSAATLEYAMAELVRNPDALLKAQDEVRGIVREKGKVEESDTTQFRYLKSVVKETLRLHPVAPLLIPRETREHININGYDLLPKTRVLVNAWAIGREMASWERPEEFIPERFTDTTVDFKGHDFQFIPFGAGRRICPGMTFGVKIVELALANLLYAFNWEAPSGMGTEGIDMDEATGTVVHLKNSLHLVATKYKY